MKPLEGKHILGIIYGTELYGSERGNLAALQSLQRSGARITVGISSRVENGGAVGEAARSLGFDTIAIPFGGPLSGQSMRAYKSYRKRQTKRLHTVSRDIFPALKNLAPTHVLIGSPLAHLYIGIALFRLGKPIIFRMGDAPEEASRVQPHLWRILAWRAKAIVANSHFVKSLVRDQGRRFERKCDVIHNIAPPRLEPMNQETLTRLKASKRPFQCVYVGQLTERKGVYALIEALASLDDPNIGCWFVGGPEEKAKKLAQFQSQLQGHASRTRIEFFGFQPDPRPYLSSADWHMAPSIYDEPFANVTLEAKASGTPSLVSDRGGFPEAVQNGINGLVVTPEVDHIRQAIQQALTMDAGKMGIAAKTSLTTTFSQDGFDAAWAKVILKTA